MHRHLPSIKAALRCFGWEVDTSDHFTDFRGSSQASETWADWKKAANKQEMRFETSSVFVHEFRLDIQFCENVGKWYTSALFGLIIEGFAGDAGTVDDFNPLQGPTN